MGQLSAVLLASSTEVSPVDGVSTFGFPLVPGFVGLNPEEELSQLTTI